MKLAKLKSGILVLATILNVFALSAPCFAVVAADADDASSSSQDDNCVKTSILGSGGEYCDEEGKGSGIFYILGLVLNVLTYGVALAATLGIVISGIQYTTAGDNSGQVQKAKNRIVQIVIGLVIYAVFWGLLQFLLPGGLFGDGS